VQDKKVIAKNIEDQARFARALFIWTDCDLEGEHIGSEIRDAALKGNNRIQVKRARFSNIERVSVGNVQWACFPRLMGIYRHILSAARRLVDLDENQVDAVCTRSELDIRTGFAFTRFLTNNLRPLGGPLSDLMISYGE
jgi:DNA topoisomerase-3